MINFCRAFRWIITYKNEDNWMPSMAVKSIKNYSKNDKNYLKIDLYQFADSDKQKYSIEEFEFIAYNQKELTLKFLDGLGQLIVQETFKKLKLVKKVNKLEYTDNKEATTRYIFEYDWHEYKLPEKTKTPEPKPVKKPVKQK